METSIISRKRLCIVICCACCVGIVLVTNWSLQKDLQVNISQMKVLLQKGSSVHDQLMGNDKVNVVDYKYNVNVKEKDKVKFDVSDYDRYDPLTANGKKFWSDVVGKNIRLGIFDNCGELYPGLNKSDHDENPILMLKNGLQKGFWSELEGLLNGTKMFDGTILTNLEQTLVYWNIAQKVPFIRTICETGFNTGESALLWLSANPDIQLYSFDIGKHYYTKPMASYLEKNFPGRFKITWGRSDETLPEFAKLNPNVKCDLVSIDGGHTYDSALSDFDNFAKMAHNGSVVLLDNYPDYRWNMWGKLGPAWEMKRRIGELLEVFKCTYGIEIGQGFSLGLMLKGT